MNAESLLMQHMLAGFGMLEEALKAPAKEASEECYCCRDALTEVFWHTFSGKKICESCELQKDDCALTHCSCGELVLEEERIRKCTYMARGDHDDDEYDFFCPECGDEI